jgi:hypothetical protein
VVTMKTLTETETKARLDFQGEISMDCQKLTSTSRLVLAIHAILTVNKTSFANIPFRQTTQIIKTTNQIRASQKAEQKTRMRSFLSFCNKT